jgi:hypothetical protein
MGPGRERIAALRIAAKEAERALSDAINEEAIVTPPVLDPYGFFDTPDLPEFRKSWGATEDLIGGKTYKFGKVEPSVPDESSRHVKERKCKVYFNGIPSHLYESQNVQDLHRSLNILWIIVIALGVSWVVLG